MTDTKIQFLSTVKLKKKKFEYVKVKENLMECDVMFYNTLVVKKVNITLKCDIQDSKVVKDCDFFMSLILSKNIKTFGTALNNFVVVHL